MSKSAVGNFRELSFLGRSFSGREENGKKRLSSRVLTMGKKRIIVSCPSDEKVCFEIKPAFILLFAAVILGFFYLYQVNDLTAQGFEARFLEKKIQDLEKESKKMKIREVELRSMYSIEKSTQELNMTNPQNVTYLEMEGPLAMK